MKHKMLIVDDDETICSSLKEVFTARGFDVVSVDTATRGLGLVSGRWGKQFRPDIVLLDVRLPDGDGMEVLTKLQELEPNLVTVMITGYGNVPQSVDAMKRGAADYVTKPFNVDELVVRVERSLDNEKLRERVGFLTKQSNGGDWESKYTQGANAAMAKIYKTIERIASGGSTTVFIHGETGTGKEVIARRVHTLSDRSTKPFVAINASALSPELLESELFGHEEGAFTGANAKKKGLFEVADGGTLFLDEIGDMDLLLQAKILRAIQDRTIRRVGGTEDIECDIRLITATNKDLEKAVQDGEFREDLYYRLMVVPIDLPPLRDRPEDIEPLLRHFLATFNTEFRREITEIEPAALQALQTYRWPGNVRELRNLLERTILLECDGNILKLEHIERADQRIGEKLRVQGAEGERDLPATDKASEVIGQAVPLEQVERQHIEAVLAGTGGNKNRAAQILGIDRTTLYNKLKKYKA
jgi:DNA-binding NtrC family response regulator